MPAVCRAGPLGPAALSRREGQPERESHGPPIARLSHIEPRVARRGREQLEVVSVEQIARPEEDAPPAGRAKPYPRVEERIAVYHEIARIACARGEVRAEAGIGAAEELAGLSEQ